MSTQGTDNLIIAGIPSVTKLWNGRFRLEFTCNPKDKNEGWYGDNITGWLPAFGTLQQAGFVTDPAWEMTDGTEWIYPDMHLVEAELRFIPAISDNMVILAYETLTGVYVEEKGEDIDHELSGLKRVSRTFVALPGAAYTKIIGTSNIQVDGVTLFLGSANIRKTDAKWELTETWLEAGELSRSENFEDGKGPKTITNIGGCPSTPPGFTPVDKKEDNTQGFPTCTITFYKDNSILSRSNDYVGSQLAEVIEVFNPTSQPTPTNGGILGSQSVSNVDGIPTTRYTFLVPSILSQSEDLIGSQLAIVIQAFNIIPSTPADYVIAKTDKSDVEGIPTNRYTFLKPSILSVAQAFTDASTTVTVNAFSRTSAQVDTALSEVTTNHKLVSQKEDDFEGIETTVYTYELESYDIIDNERNGLRRVLRTRLRLASQFYSSEVGITTIQHEINDGEAVTLYLAGFKIEDTVTFRKVTETWIEAGQLSENDPLTGPDRLRVRVVVWQMIQGANPSGYVASSIKTDNIEGFPTISVSYFLSADLSASYVYETTVPFTIPGTVDVRSSTFGGSGGNNLMLDVSPPIPTLCEAVITETYTTSTTISTSGLYQPDVWTGVIIEGVGQRFRPFSSTSTYRNHIAKSTGGSATTPLTGTLEYIQGNLIFAQTTGYIRIDGPSSDVAGTTVDINITLNPVFRLADGTQYYKEVTTTAKVPSRG